MNYKDPGFGKGVSQGGTSSTNPGNRPPSAFLRHLTYRNEGDIIRVPEKVSAPYMIRDLAPLAQEVADSGKKVYWLNIGDPGLFGFLPPQEVTDAIAWAVKSRAYTGYPPSQGDPDLIDVLAKMEGVPKERILVSAGLSEGISFIIRTLVAPGEHMLLPGPGYSLYNSCDADESQILESSNFYAMGEGMQPDPDDICRKISERTKGLVVINPNNPAGAVYDGRTLQFIAEIAKEARIPIFSDEIYNMLVLDGSKAASIIEYAGGHPVIVGNGISKNFFYPGARVGYLAVHGDVSDGMLKMISSNVAKANKRLATNWEMQRGALAAYTMPRERLATYRAEQLRELRLRRDIVVDGLSKIPGITLYCPEAAFYAFARVESERFENDLEFTKALLKETGVFVIPGCGFSPGLPGKYFRLVFLAPPDELREAIAKIAEFMRAHS